MNFLKNIFGQKNEPIKSNEDFWNWFQQKEKSFAKVVKEHSDIEQGFFDKLSPKLNELKPGFFFLTGMLDDDTVELVITPEGIIKNIVFVEELIEAAPKIEGWKFTGLKPALDINDIGIEMSGYKFSTENMSFYSNDNPQYPDEIDITVIHDNFSEEDKPTITNGVYIFLDNTLGEFNFATSIDNITVTGKADDQKELVPIEKLKDFLIWREKEFVEKYEGLRYDTENDKYSAIEGEMDNGNPLIAILNTDLLAWDSKASHPWVMVVEIKYDGSDHAGMPDDKTFKLLDDIEDLILKELKDSEGYLNIGRQTADSLREIYFACHDFRKPSKVLHQIQGKYSGIIDIQFDIYKDKYWRTFERYTSNN